MNADDRCAFVGGVLMTAREFADKLEELVLEMSATDFDQVYKRRFRHLLDLAEDSIAVLVLAERRFRDMAESKDRCPEHLTKQDGCPHAWCRS